MKYTTAIAATLAVAHAAPVEQVCKIVTSVVYGQPTWVPNAAADPTWGSWDPSKPAESKKTTTAAQTWSEWDPSKTPVPTSKKTTTSAWEEWDPTKPKTTTKAQSSTWADWDPSKPVPTSTKKTSESWSAWTSTTKSADPTSKKTDEWESWTSTTTKKAAETTTKNGGGFYPSPTTTAVVTTSAAQTTTAATTPSTTASTTTSAAAQPTSCSTQQGTFLGVSDGTCTYDVYCQQGVDQALVSQLRDSGKATFWEEDSSLHNSIGECQAICDRNADCEAVIYVDAEGAREQDYKHCWMVKGLPTPTGSGYGQLSYKKSCN